MRYSRLLAVATPANYAGLVSLDVVKDELGINNATIDTRLNRWISESTAAIEGFVGRTLRMEEVTETFRASHFGFNGSDDRFYPRIGGCDVGANQSQTAELVLRRYPIVAVTSIVEDATTTLTAGTDYEVDTVNGELYRLDGTVRIPWYAQLIVVTYTGGYDTVDAVPSDLQTACLLMLKHRQSAQGRDPMLKSIMVPGVLEQQFWVGGMAGGQSAMLPEVESLIARFRGMAI